MLRARFFIFLAALALYLFHFFHTTARDFAVDPESHFSYIRYIDEHGALPKVGEPSVIAAHHLPFYYLLAAPVYHSTHSFEAVRLVSLVLYGMFLALAAVMFRRVLQGQAYLFALALAVFWPLAAVMATRIHLDLLSYVGQMGLIYFLLRWLLDRKSEALANAFVFLGIFFLARYFAVYFALAALAFWAWAVAHKEKVLTPRMMASMVFAAACCAWATWHHTMFPDTAFPGLRPETGLSELLRIFFFFDPLLFVTETATDPNIGTTMPLFWHRLLRTAVLGDGAEWKWPALLLAVNTVWLAMLAYMAHGLWAARRQWDATDKKTLLFFGLIAGMMVGMLMSARFVYLHMPALGDARYVFSIVVLFIACYAKAMDWHRQGGRAALEKVGRGLGLGLILLTLMLYAGQHLVKGSAL